MRSLSSVGLGLSIVFGCLLLALVAELYYLLWWKRRLTSTEMEDDLSGPARELLYMHCWKKPSTLSSRALNPQELCSSDRITDTHMLESHDQIQIDRNKDFLFKPFGEDDTMEADQLMYLHDLSGPPRFLFTIKEETKEDLESEDGRSRGDKSVKGSRSRSLSDILLTVETPFLTPLSSPPFFTPPLTPMDSSYNNHGVNPLFQSGTDTDQFNRNISSSPPPKFKFLKDAEEKLQRKVMEEEEEEAKKEQLQLQFEVSASVNNSVIDYSPSTSMLHKDEEDGSFITIVVGKNRERQILPLVSSPSTFNPPVSKKPIFHHISTY